MNIFLPGSKVLLNSMLAFLLMQLGSFPQDDPYENPLTRASTLTTEFVMFNQDFSSLNLDNLMKWVNPSLGLVKNGILLTKDEARAEFNAGFYGANRNNLLEVNIQFNYGDFASANTYQADTWIEYKLREGGTAKWYRFHNQFVFKIINSQWFLVQSEFIPADASLALDFQNYASRAENVPAWVQPFITQISETQLSGVSSWPLLIGSNYVRETSLHPIEGKTPSGATWKLTNAVAAKKPVVLYFVSIQYLSVAFSEDFNSQMNFLKDLYNTFGRQDLYIYLVTDEHREVLQWIGDAGYTWFAPLLDEGSRMHAALNINMHPYIVVFDSQGSVVALSKTDHPSTNSLIKDRIREAIAMSK